MIFNYDAKKWDFPLVNTRLKIVDLARQSKVIDIKTVDLTRQNKVTDEIL